MVTRDSAYVVLLQPTNVTVYSYNKIYGSLSVFQIINGAFSSGTILPNDVLMLLNSSGTSNYVRSNITKQYELVSSTSFNFQSNLALVGSSDYGRTLLANSDNGFTVLVSFGKDFMYPQ